MSQEYLGKENIINQNNEELKEDIDGKENIEDFEKELSPEVIEKIMKKVQDINQEGTTFTVLNPRGGNYKFFAENVLRIGLIPGFAYFFDLEKDHSFKKMREFIGEGERKNRPLYFNIIGRCLDAEKLNEISSMKIDKNSVSKENRLAIIFDISSFQERKKAVYGAYRSVADLSDLSLKYAIDLAPGNEKIPWHEKIKTTSGHGFVTTSIISPKLFKGMVTNEDSEDIIKELPNIIYNVNKENSKRFLIPIYNAVGDLLWPKRMSYKEVKKFVAERDENKKESEKT